MRVELAREVFQDDGAGAEYDLHALISLLRCFVERRHEWVTNSGVVPAVAAFLRDNLSSLADTYVALARDAAVAAIWTGTTQTGDIVRVSRADLDDYSHDLCQSAVLVVENQKSDGHFVTSIAHAFRSERVRVALERTWLVIENGGGSGTVVPVAREAAKRFRRLIRVSALLDSDRLIPKQRTQNHEKADVLAADGIVVHVLALREAENYAPYRVLGGIGRQPAASKRLRHFKQLDSDQRAHFDMKKGFTKPRSRAPEVRAEQRTLFDGLDAAILVGLHHGFGDGILEHMHEIRESLSERDFAHLGAESVAELRSLLAKLAGTI